MTTKPLKIFWKSLKIIAFLLCAGLLIAFWNLYRGGLGLGFITPLAIEILTPDDADLKVEIAKSELTWTKSPLPIGIKVSGFKMLNQNDQVVSEVPEMKVSLSLRALLSFKLALGSMEFNRPYVHLFVAKDGNLGVGFDTEGKKENLISLTAFKGQKNSSELYRYLKHFRINNGRLAIHDDLIKYSWIFPDINIVVNRNSAFVEAEGLFNLRQNDSLAPIQFVSIFDNESSLLHIDAEVANFYLNDSVGLKKILANAEIGVPLSGNITATLDFSEKPDWKNFRERFKKATFSLQGKKGNILIPEPIGAHYDIKSLSLKGEAAIGLASVNITDFSVVAKDGGSGTAFAKILNLDKVIDDASLLPLRIEFNAKTKNIPLDKLKWYWPSILGRNTHTWVVKNINGGMVKNSSFYLEFSGTESGGIEMDKVQGKAEISGTTVRYLESMPLVHDVDGEVILNKDDVRVKIKKGKSLNLELYYADLFFYDIWEPIELASVTIKAKGDVHDALTLADTKPMDFLRAMGMSAKGTSGYCDTELKIDFPLRKDLTVNMVKVSAKAKITGATLPIFQDYTLENANLNLEVNNDKMQVSGVALVKNVGVDFTWQETFGGKKAGSAYNISMLLDKTGREVFGLDFYPFTEPTLSGITGVKINAEVNKKKQALITVEGDLTDARIYEPLLGIDKLKKVPASLKAYLKANGSEITVVDSFQLSSLKNFDVRGRLDMGKANKLKNIYIDKFIAGKNNGSADILFLPNGSLNIKLKADTFDAAPFFDDEENGESIQGNTLKAYALQGIIGKLWLSEQGYINQVDLRMVQNDSRLENALFKALTSTDARLRASYMPAKEEKGVYNFSLWGGDAGAVLEAFGYTQNVKGGILKIEANSKTKGELVGTLRMKDFRVVKAPVLAKILSIASLTGVLDLLQGDGIGFEVANVPFEYKNSAIYVKNAYTSGLSIGLTANGIMKNNILNLEGTIVPAYLFNSFLGKIPVLGALFSGGEAGGGLFAFTYKVSGDISNPKITVNPLSALAPGFIRGVFTGSADIDDDDDNNND